MPLANLSPRAQLSAGRMAHRLGQLLVGLVLYGVSMAMMVRAGLGLNPWDVFHAGVSGRVGWTFGQVTIVVGALVLLLSVIAGSFLPDPDGGSVGAVNSASSPPQ